MAMGAFFDKSRYSIIRPLTALLVLSGCAKPPAPPPVVPPPKPTVLNILLHVSPLANPDARGRASPVVVRVYELKTVNAFQAADFFSLYERDKETLGGELVAKDEMVLQPDDRRAIKRELQADTRFVAVMAAYRDLDRARWRASMPVTLNATEPVRIDVQERQVSIEKNSGR